MNFASSYCRVQKKKAFVQPQFNAPINNDIEIDTNVISINFNNLKEAEKTVQMGDPLFCKGCQSCLSMHSHLTTVEEYKQQLEKKPQEPPKEVPKNIIETIVEEDKEGFEVIPKPPYVDNVLVDDLKPHNKIWKCEFCNFHNVVSVEPEEIPSKDDIIYVKESASQAQKNNTNNESDITVIFCIDLSGSMSITNEVEGKHDLRHGLSAEEYEMLKQYIDQGADQNLPNQKKNVTYISRKQCVFAAIENQIKEMLKLHPKRKVGLVTFNDEVCIIGDGSSHPEILAGDKLNKYDLAIQIGISSYERLLSNPIEKSQQQILDKFGKLEANGKTALGPALLASVGLASQGKEGSMVIICTDGVANIGLGEVLDNLAAAEVFYNDVGQVAKSKGTSISVMSIKGEGCKLDVLSKVADITSGNLTRVDPKDITKDFANILKDEVIATKVEFKIKLHNGFRFRNEKQESLLEGGSLCKKEVGNVTAKTDINFEYENKSDEELKNLNIDIDAMKEIPFQAVVSYISTDGHHLLRVITKKLKATQNQQEAEKHAKVNILAGRALQKQAVLAIEGNLDEAEKVGQKWGQYMQDNVLLNNLENNEVLDQYNDWNCKQARIEGAVKKTKARGMERMAAKEEKVSGGGGFFQKLGKIFSPTLKSEVSPSKKEESMEKIQLPKSSMMQESAEAEDEDTETFYNFKHLK